jgi:tetratricopeptide (TPR) repeat protein
MSDGFDVFVCYSSTDKIVARHLTDQLKARGLRVWLDELELIPGQPWQEGLEEGIQASRAIAVLLGRDGPRPWQKEEMQVALQLAVQRRLPVIPVLLPGVSAEPELSPFLRSRTWVDLRQGLSPAGLDRLEWGIKTERIENESTDHAIEGQRPLGWIAPGIFNRLVLLFKESKAAWVIGVFSTGADREILIDSLTQRIAPAPVHVVSFGPDVILDPLVHLQRIPAPQNLPPPVVCFTGILFAVPDLAQHLDNQREALARLPHRILLWVSEQERAWLVENAPNFCSRLSGTFDFRRPPSRARRPAPALPILLRPVEDLLPRSWQQPSIAPAAALDRARRRMAEIDLVGSREQRAGAYMEVAGLLEMAPRDFERVAQIHEAYIRAAADASDVGEKLVAAEALWRAAGIARFDPRLFASVRNTLEKVLVLFNEIATSGGSDALKAEIGLAATWTGLASCDLLDGSFATAIEKADRAARIYFRRGAFAGQALALRVVGSVAILQQSWSLADTALRLSAEISERLQRKDLLAPSLQLLGDAYSRQGRRDGAALLDRAVALAKEADDRLTQGNALLSLGHVHLASGDPDAAESSYLHALDVLRRIEFEPAVANALMSLSGLLLSTDRDQEASAAHGEAEEIYRRWGFDRVFTAAGVTS